jgi:hypothetical protein
MAGIEAFVQLWAVWHREAGAALKQQEPGFVIDVLRSIASRPKTQTAIARELKVNQPRVAKLLPKLVERGWIKRVKAAIRATPDALEALDRVEQGCSSLLSPPAEKRVRRSKPRPASNGQMPLPMNWELEETQVNRA